MLAFGLFLLCLTQNSTDRENQPLKIPSSSLDFVMAGVNFY